MEVKVRRVEGQNQEVQGKGDPLFLPATAKVALLAGALELSVDYQEILAADQHSLFCDLLPSLLTISTCTIIIFWFYFSNFNIAFSLLSNNFSIFSTYTAFSYHSYLS